jgi:hypothetical protein
VSDARIEWLRTAVMSLRTAITAAALTLLLGLGAVSVFSPPETPTTEIGLSVQDEDVNRLMERYQCSLTGFDPGVIPATAVIRDRLGRTRLVSFDHGWAVFNDERPGELVAVCLGSARAAGH